MPFENIPDIDEKLNFAQIIVVFSKLILEAGRQAGVVGKYFETLGYNSPLVEITKKDKTNYILMLEHIVKFFESLILQNGAQAQRFLDSFFLLDQNNWTIRFFLNRFIANFWYDLNEKCLKIKNPDGKDLPFSQFLANMLTPMDQDGVKKYMLSVFCSTYGSDIEASLGSWVEIVSKRVQQAVEKLSLDSKALSSRDDFFGFYDDFMRKKCNIFFRERSEPHPGFTGRHPTRITPIGDFAVRFGGMLGIRDCLDAFASQNMYPAAAQLGDSQKSYLEKLYETHYLKDHRLRNSLMFNTRLTEDEYCYLVCFCLEKIDRWTLPQTSGANPEGAAFSLKPEEFQIFLFVQGLIDSFVHRLLDLLLYLAEQDKHKPEGPADAPSHSSGVFSKASAAMTEANRQQRLVKIFEKNEDLLKKYLWFVSGMVSFQKKMTEDHRGYYLTNVQKCPQNFYDDMTRFFMSEAQKECSDLFSKTKAQLKDLIISNFETHLLRLQNNQNNCVSGSAGAVGRASDTEDKESEDGFVLVQNPNLSL